VQHEGDGGPGSKSVIGTVMRRGYKLGEHVLRNALVGVIETVTDTVGGDTTAETGHADTAGNADASAE